MTQISKAWIFVSHSTKDLDKVRAVRDAIENIGGEPILFFLKCLSDHDEIDENRHDTLGALCARE